MPSAAGRLLHAFTAGLSAHPVLAFGVMGLSFIGFGLVSLNMIHLLSANIGLVFEYGVTALLDGALHQLFELLALGFSGLAMYLVFKVCEKILVEKLLHEHGE